MCAQFELQTPVKRLETKFGFTFPFNIASWNERVLPYTKSPVITSRGIRMMNFSLIPSWSKDKKPKFATHNARLETITEKATWKKPFQSKHCLVPLTSFIEPIYTNKLAGNMVKFKTHDGEILVAAGIYDEWVDKETGEITESFAIITSEPISFVKSIGHDRSPVFVSEDIYKDWISNEQQDPKVLLELLKAGQIIPYLETEVDRPLKPGWEKRI